MTDRRRFLQGALGADIPAINVDKPQRADIWPNGIADANVFPQSRCDTSALAACSLDTGRRSS